MRIIMCLFVKALGYSECVSVLLLKHCILCPKIVCNCYQNVNINDTQWCPKVWEYTKNKTSNLTYKSKEKCGDSEKVNKTKYIVE